MAAGFSKILCNLNSLHSYDIISFLRNSYPYFFDIEFEDDSVDDSNVDDSLICSEILKKGHVYFEYRISEMSRIFLYIFYDGTTLIEDYEFFAITSADQDLFKNVFENRTISFSYNKTLIGAIFDDYGNSRYEYDWDSVLSNGMNVNWFSGLSFLAVPHKSSLANSISEHELNGYYFYKF